MEERNNGQTTKPETARILPHDTDVERAVLGAIILESTAFPKVAYLLTEASFYDMKHRSMFRAIASLYSDGSPIDMVTVTDRARSLGLLSETPGTSDGRISAYDIASITGTVGGGANIEYHAAILQRLERKRTILQLQGKVAQAAQDAAGDFEAALAELRAYMEASAPGQKMASIVKDPTEEDFMGRMKQITTGIPVDYEFASVDRSTTRQLILPGGALTYICAPTSHGKSTFLRNLALQIAQQPDPGRVLYFTFEESETDLWAQFLNLYMDRDLHKPTKKYNNIKSIRRYFREGPQSMDMWTRDACQFFPGYLKRFKEEILCMEAPGNRGKLKIINRDLDILELVSSIEYYSRTMERHGRTVKAVFIDYVQLLTAKGKNRSRKEELVEVTNELMQLSVKMGIPFVLAAQLNRETKSPLMLFNQNMADSSDLEKSANLIVCLWNSNQEAQDPSYYGFGCGYEKGILRPGKPNRETERLEELGFFAGGQKKYGPRNDLMAIPPENRSTIYAKITKYRGEEVGLEAILKWRPNTGRIENLIKESRIQEDSLPFPPQSEEFI